MPYVNVQITKGATRAEKQTIVKEITETLVNTLKKTLSTFTLLFKRLKNKTGGLLVNLLTIGNVNIY